MNNKIINKNNGLQFVLGVTAVAMAITAPVAYAWEYVKLRTSTSLRVEDNVFRLPDGVNATTPSGERSRSDVIRTDSMGASLEVPLSRQQLLISYDANRSRYSKFSNLDFDGDDKRAILRWEFGRLATGDAGVTQTTTQTDFATSLGRRSNLRTSTQKFINYSYPFHPWWQFSGGVSQTESSNSDFTNRVSDSITDGANLELRYAPGSGNFIGVRTNHITSKFPNPGVVAGLPVDNGYTQNALALVAGYVPGGASSLQFTLGQSRRAPNDTSRNPTTGATGSFAASWLPTGKTSVSLVASRDFAPAENITTSGSVANILQLGLAWNATAKISVRGDLGYQKRNYSLTPLSAVQLPQRADTTTSAGLSLNYAAHDRLSLALSFRQEQRTSTLPGTDYAAGIVSASAQLNF